MTNLTQGTKVMFTPTGKIFELKTVTDKKVIWFVAIHKGGTGINNLKTAGTSRSGFEKSIKKGIYKIID